MDEAAVLEVLQTQPSFTFVDLQLKLPQILSSKLVEILTRLVCEQRIWQYFHAGVQWYTAIPVPRVLSNHGMSNHCLIRLTTGAVIPDDTTLASWVLHAVAEATQRENAYVFVGTDTQDILTVLVYCRDVAVAPQSTDDLQLLVLQPDHLPSMVHADVLAHHLEPLCKDVQSVAVSAISSAYFQKIYYQLYRRGCRKRYCLEKPQ